jgi:1,4-dihydroxy-2-naphthoate octaprenyltransferase
VKAVDDSSVPRGLTPWILAIRPRTLPLAASPVLVGTALAWHAGASLRPGTFLATLFAAMAIQAGTNLYNDAADAERGVDRPTRRGPPRVTAMGWLAPAQVRAGALASFALAALLGLQLIAVGGWPILLLGLLSLLSGLAYSAGPRPISFTALGEAFVLLFFGIGAVGGTYYLQAGDLTAAAPLAGVMLGLQAAAVLHLNNTRDAVDDARAGRRTLAIRLGPGRSPPVYAGLVLAPYPLLVALAAVVPGSQPLFWLPALSLPLALTLARRGIAARTGADFNRLLSGTVQLEAAFAVLMCIALAW